MDNPVKLSTQEKHIIEKISCITGVSEKTIREVLKGLFLYAILELHVKKEKFCIPYFFNVNLELSKEVATGKFKLKENYDIETNPNFRKILISMIKEETTWIETVLKSEIKDLIKNILVEA